MGKRRPYYLEFEAAIDVARLCWDRLDNTEVRNTVITKGYNFIEFVIQNTLSHFEGMDVDEMRSYIWEKIIGIWFPKVDWSRGRGEIMNFLIRSIQGYALNSFNELKKYGDLYEVHSNDVLEPTYRHDPLEVLERRERGVEVRELAKEINLTGDEQVALRTAQVLKRRERGKDI